MCEICVRAQDAAEPTGDGATADAWHRASEALSAWLRSLPDNHDAHHMSEHDRLMAWADHIDSTTVERVIN